MGSSLADEGPSLSMVSVLIPTVCAMWDELPGQGILPGLRLHQGFPMCWEGVSPSMHPQDG